MLSFSGSLKVWVALEPTDMRKGFNGLLAAVSQRLGGPARAEATVSPWSNGQCSSRTTIQLTSLGKDTWRTRRHWLQTEPSRTS